MKVSQPSWDKYEAAILLDALIKIKEGKLFKDEAIRKVSSELRRMAVNNGMKIDEIYRNENGIKFQMSSMESAYDGETVSIPATRLFSEIAEIYKTDHAQFEKILGEARSMVNSKKSKKADFYSWLSQKISVGQVQEIKSALCEIESQARKTNIIKSSIYDNISPDTIKKIRAKMEQSKIFKFIHKRQWKSIIAAPNYLQQYAEKEITVKSKPIQEKDKAVNNGSLIGDSALEEFSHWLLAQGMSESSARGYPNAIRQAENYAKSRSYTNCVLVTDNSELCIATVNELFSNNEFIVYNHEQHNRFRAAITKLLEFYGLEYAFSRYNFKNKRGLDEVAKRDKVVRPDESIRSILMSRYEYGFTCDSLRELMRFRQAADEMGIALPDDDEELKTAIMSSGIFIDGKVYCKNEDMLKELQQIVADILNSGAKVIYYESLFEVNQEWMSSHTITSPEMLKEYLRNCIKDCSFSKKFIAKGEKFSEKETVSKEIQRVWGDKSINSVYELRDHLPYIPINNIWRAISGNDDFVLTSDGEYLFIERFRITKDEASAILRYADEAYEENGFVSISDIPLESVEEENYELPKFAIYNAVYKKVLREKYNLNGKILTKDQNELDAIALLKQYIKDKDKCTFDEVADKVIELTGGINRQYAFQALYDEMIRVDLNHFVANKFVDFHVDEIDAVLSGFITDGFCAIRDITTFAMFPLCGQSWNHYLLESFCYKYSRKYTLCIINFNDKNAGIIAEKDYNKKYDDMLAIAAARSGVALSPEAVGKYLFEAGYMARSKFSKLDEITQKASELRKERE